MISTVICGLGSPETRTEQIILENYSLDNIHFYDRVWYNWYSSQSITDITKQSNWYCLYNLKPTAALSYFVLLNFCYLKNNKQLDYKFPKQARMTFFQTQSSKMLRRKQTHMSIQITRPKISSTRPKKSLFSLRGVFFYWLLINLLAPSYFSQDLKLCRSTKKL